MRSEPLAQFNEVIETYRAGLLASMGLRGRDLAKPLVGIIHGYNQMSPGNIANAPLVEAAKVGIAGAGGTPVEIPIPGVCGSMSGGADSFRFNFPYRDAAASLAELLISINRLDACLFMPNCDNVVPAYLLAALRVNLPCIFVTGGYMQPGKRGDKPFTAFDIPKVVSAQAESGGLTEQLREQLICSACPTPGACPEIGTAGTMASVMEALGLSLPGNATLAAQEAALVRLTKDAAEVLLQAWRDDLRVGAIVTPEALEDAARVVLAIGGSPNVLLHVLAFAQAAETGLSLQDWDHLSRETPLLCRIKPNHPLHTFVEFAQVGGVYRLLQEMKPLLHLERPTVTGRSLGQMLADWQGLRPAEEAQQVVASLTDPVSPEGGIAVLYGNLAEDGAVLKTSAVDADLQEFRGPARVYDSELAAAEALFAGQVAEGSVLVVRYEGPKGSPGAREVMLLMHAVVGMGLSRKIAVVTDGRFSGTNLGLAVGHVCPEAPEGGLIALVEDGDLVEIDLRQRRLELLVEPAVVEARRQVWQCPAPKADRGLLLEWAKHGGPLSRGGVLGD